MENTSTLIISILIAALTIIAILIGKKIGKKNFFLSYKDNTKIDIKLFRKHIISRHNCWSVVWSIVLLTYTIVSILINENQFPLIGTLVFIIFIPLTAGFMGYFYGIKKEIDGF